MGRMQKGFVAHAFPIQNSKSGNRLSCLKIFNWKLKINLNVKLMTSQGQQFSLEIYFEILMEILQA